jgi:hypothetical protein
MFNLQPRGREISPGMMGRLAQGGGVLAGAVLDGVVRTWLTDTNGQLTLIMWPGNFRARLDPLEVVDDQGNVVARGGELVTVTGNLLPDGDPRVRSDERVFAAWQVSRPLQDAR